MFAVVRDNPEYRKLWLAQVVSSAGDWLNRMALIALIGSLGGPQAEAGLGALFGIELALRLLPTAFFGPLAGPIADRLPRRPLMITADLLRAAVVLGFLLVDEAEELPLLYGLLLAQMSVAIFFDSARSASVPNTVAPRDLHAAYALSAATWSAMLALGAALGGLILGLVGLTGVFLLDSASYVLSALLVARVALPSEPATRAPLHWKDVVLLRDLRRAARHLAERGALVFALAKGFWGACGGYLVMLSIAGKLRHADAFGGGLAAVGMATSLLYAARGLGTGAGPILARRWTGVEEPGLRRQILAGFVVGGVGYAFFGPLESLVLALVAVAIAHCGGSALWVASTTGWQQRIDDAYRGRCYSLEFLAMTLSFTLGAVGTGWVYDRTESIEIATWAASGGVLVGGAAWWLLARRLPALPPDIEPVPAAPLAERD